MVNVDGTAVSCRPIAHYLLEMPCLDGSTCAVYATCFTAEPHN